MKLRDFLTEEDDPEYIEAIIKLFARPEKVDDADVHRMAESFGKDPDEFEGVVYGILQSFLSKGRANEMGITEEDVDPDQLKMGIKVEYEHTTSRHLAKRIALDHLSEIKDYYSRLKKMESDAWVEE